MKLIVSFPKPESLATSVLTTLRSLIPSQPTTAFSPLQSLIDHGVSQRRFLVVLVTLFAALGALLAALGIYGVISHSVTQKAEEIGVRMALGAGMRRVQDNVLMKTYDGTRAPSQAPHAGPGHFSVG